MAIQLSEKGYERLQAIIPFGFGFGNRPNINGTAYRNMAILFLIIAQLIIWTDGFIPILLACILISEGVTRDLFGTHRSVLYQAVNKLLTHVITPIVIKTSYKTSFSLAKQYALALSYEGECMDDKKEILAEKGLNDEVINQLVELDDQIIKSERKGISKWISDQFGVHHLNSTTSNYMKKRLLDRMLWVIGTVAFLLLLNNKCTYIIPMTMMSILATFEIVKGFCLPCWVAEWINRHVEIKDS